MSLKRRTYVVGVSLSLSSEEIQVEEEMSVAHLGDPPFTLAVAAPGDPREPMLTLSDGSFLTDIAWLTPKRAKGRVLFSLLEGAAEAVEFQLDMTDEMLSELTTEVERAEKRLAGKTGGADDAETEDDDEVDPVEDFIERVNNGEISELDVLDFDTIEDFRRVLGDDMTEDDFQYHRATMDELVEEARVRGLPVIRTTADAHEFRDWLAQNEGVEPGPHAMIAFAEYLRARQLERAASADAADPSAADPSNDNAATGK
jgi:hypothetical protein